MELDSEYPDWPKDALISLENITVRYQKDLTPALQNVTVTIKGGEKVGVVGR
jgi:ABC-type multidrug transport system fused ATPase/permease subunit